MDALTDLAQLQSVVSKYVDQYNLVVAAGPLTAASVARVFVNNKLATGAVAATGVWFAVKELSGPVMNLITDQFGYLQSIFALFANFN